MRTALLSIAALATMFFTACNSTNNTSSSANGQTEGIFKVISPADFKAALTANADQLQLIDVRTPQEVAAGAIEGSTNLDFNAGGFKEKIAALDKEKPVYLYCASGGRSGKTLKMMQSMGFKEVYDLKGGYSSWK